MGGGRCEPPSILQLVEQRGGIRMHRWLPDGKVLALLVLGLLIAGTSAWGGENADATLSVDLEIDGQMQPGDQTEQTTLSGIDPDVTVVLSLYANGAVNLTGYDIEVVYDTTKVSFVSGVFISMTPPEFGALWAAGLSPSTLGPILDPEDPSVLALSASVLPVPSADVAPDGDGLALVFLKFKTKGTFTMERVDFWLKTLKYVDSNGETDDVKGNIDASLPLATINPEIAVELFSWGKIKQLFR